MEAKWDPKSQLDSSWKPSMAILDLPLGYLDFQCFLEGFQNPPKSQDRQKLVVFTWFLGPINKYKRLPEAVDLTGKQTFADHCRPSGRKLITSDNRTRSQYPQPYAPDKQGPADIHIYICDRRKYSPLYSPPPPEPNLSPSMQRGLQVFLFFVSGPAAWQLTRAL